VLGTTAIAGFIAPVHAQESGGELEEVKVTGSRILRRDLDASSPLVTVGSDSFESSGTIALEANLNKLPQFVPSVTQFVTNDVQNTATNTVGASTINLRGLGANRTLVLLDGRRAMPVNASLVVDINTIPSAAIKRVEIISGGASSTYGADAVGGVVNFILKNDFEGMEFDTQYGMTELGDDQELRVSGLMGGNFSDNRGNAMFGVEYFKRGAARQDERDFFTKGWADPSVAGTEAFLPGTSYAPGGNTPSQAAIDGIFTQAPGLVGRGSTFFFNTNGTAFTPADPDGVYRYNGVLDNRLRKIGINGTLTQNQLESLASIPSDRYSLFGRADYDVRDNLSFFVQGNFTKTNVRTVLQFSPAVAGWSAQIADPATGLRNDTRYPIPAELATLLNSRANPNAPWELDQVLDFLGPRGSSDSNQTYQVVAGLSGTLPIKDWTWEGYVSHGNTEVTSVQTGFASLERYRKLVLAPNYGKGAVLTGNATGGGFAAGQITCTSGLPIFQDFIPSQDCIDAISANLQSNSSMDQDIAEVNLQGAIVDLPAGELRGAVGGSWRKNTFGFRFDNLASATSFVDQAVGLFPANSTFGQDTVKEGFVEFVVPVLADLPAVKKLNLELGYRFSDYDTVGSVDTYKALADWTIVDSVRFRGGYQRANRAPNIGELFLPDTQRVGGTAFGDPCGVNTLATYGVNPATNRNGPTGAAAARAFCNNLLGAAAPVYYATQIPGTGFFPFATTIQQGNLNLKSEVADTYTAGFVFRPNFDAKLLNRLTASIDWYRFDIANTIAALSFDTVYSQCMDPVNNPTQTLNNVFCQLVTRDPNNGTPAKTLTPFRNAGNLKTSGVDVNVDWAADLADMGMASLPGALSVNLAVTYLDEFKFQEIANAPVLDYTGTVGGIGTNNNGQFRYKTYLTTTYSVGGISASLRWRHLPSAHSAAYAQNVNTPFQGPDHYDVFDLTGNWEISQTYQVRFGVENLLDKDPEVTNSNPTAGGSFTTGQGTTLPGYYDVLGRRYYVGFKARF
jgi:outer membrane receptor protein involved in Fe transport